jgi:hypothetical protein
MGARRSVVLIGACCAVAVASTTPPPRYADAAVLAAGTTAAVLSFVDAASDDIEVVRHWPQAPTDVVLRPMVPYFWDGCPGPGAILILLSAPAGNDVASRAAAMLSTARAPDAFAAGALAELAAELRTPGDPAFEAIKAAAPLIGSLDAYERAGYAVFLFVRWTGTRCAAAVEAVPEGYGIPYVR